MLRAKAKLSSNSVDLMSDVTSVNSGRTGRGCEESCEHGHGRGFSRSVVAQKRRDLAFVEVEGQIVDSHLAGAEIIKLTNP